MSFIGDFIGDITGTNKAADTAAQASRTQAASAQQGIDEQRRQFDAMVKLMQPFVSAGSGSLGQQQALIGLGGTQAQQQAIAALEGGPQMQALLRQGETAILQNASATGGLRGGNTQAALAQFRPQLLNQLINQQYSNLAGITSLGQNAAAMQGNAGMQTGANVANLLGQQGSALAGGQMAYGNAAVQNFNTAMQVAGMAAGAGMFGGGSAATGSMLGPQVTFGAPSTSMFAAF